MKSVRQQRVGRGYFNAIVRDAGRPYDFRGGLRRLLNAGAATSARAAYTYGSLPFNLKYLQHSVYGYGNEWPVTPAPAVTVPDNRYPVSRPPATASWEDGGYRTEADTGGPEARQSRPAVIARVPDARACSLSSSTPASSPNSPVSGVHSQVLPAQRQSPGHKDERMSSERLRQGPPPLVTTRSIGGPRNRIQPAAGLSGKGTDDNGVAINHDLGEERDEAPAHSVESGQVDKTSVQHVLGRLARQLEAHNFGGQRQQDVERQFNPGRTKAAGETHQPDQSSSEEPVFPIQRYKRPSGSSVADVSVSGSRLNQPVSAHVSPPPPAFHEVSADTVQAQLRLMSNLKKQAAAGQRGAGGKSEPETPASKPVKPRKKPLVNRTRMVVRHTVVRRAVAAAFWERSYLSHAALRLYK